MDDPESDRKRPRESVVERRETKKVRINVLDGEESDEWVEAEEEWVRIPTVVPDVIYALCTTLRADPS